MVARRCPCNSSSTRRHASCLLSWCFGWPMLLMHCYCTTLLQANSHSPRRPRKHVAFQLEPKQHAPPSGTSSSYDPSPIRFCIADAVAAMHTASPTRVSGPEH